MLENIGDKWSFLWDKQLINYDITATSNQQVLTIREIDRINDLVKRMNDLCKRMSDLCKRIEWDVTT